MDWLKNIVVDTDEKVPGSITDSIVELFSSGVLLHSMYGLYVDFLVFTCVPFGETPNPAKGQSRPANFVHVTISNS